MRARASRLTITAIALLTLIAALAIAETPTELSDAEFWELLSDFSEPSGAFHSENLVSNELLFQTVIPHLMETVKPGRAYIGVGSEQNFTYIAALRPSISFIVDIRRGNLDLHLLYKALFELSADRAEFVSRLFSRPRPSRLSTSSTLQDILAAYSRAVPSQELYERNLKEVSAFYVSNVEQYLREDGLWNAFCASAATLPADTSSTFIRSSRGGFQGQPVSRGLQRGGAEFVMTLAPMESQLAQCAGK